MNSKKFSIKNIREYLKENYLMSIDLKRDLVSKNINVLFYIMTTFTVFGIIMFAITLIKSRNDIYANKQQIIYYGVMWFFGLQDLLYVLMAKKHVEWNPYKRNLSLYMGYMLIMMLSIFYLVYSPEPLRAFIPYAIITIISISFFTFEPFFFIIFTTIFTLIFIIILIKKGEAVTSGNLIIYFGVVIYFSMYKWRTLIKNQKYAKNLKEHSDNLETELKLASYVQQSFYKTDLTNLDNYEVKVYSKAFAGVSGDLYDFCKDKNKLDGVGIFDVSGHGISSGLITMLVRNIIHQEFYYNKDKNFEDVVNIIDERIKNEKGNVENYLSGVLIRINDDRLEIVNAGHPNPILYRHDVDGIYYLDNEKKYSSTVLGLNSIESFFHSYTIEMKKGDELFLYTDGITDTYNKQREPFGTLRLSEAVMSMMNLDFDEQVPYLLNQLDEFKDKAPDSDDITLIILKKK